ncbi:MAG: hypothetical protein HY720_06045, partial [Planctomycetes bacterium]|nr:hypothetical protein [Planctomycetota bacterium]
MMPTFDRDEVVARICVRLGIVPEETIRRLRAAGTNGAGLLEVLRRERCLDRSSASRVEEMLRQVESRLDTESSPPPRQGEGNSPLPLPT